MSWLCLVVAGLLEAAWAVGLKRTDGFTRLWPSVATVTAMAGSFFLLAHAMRSLPVGTAYAVWTGIGVTGVAAFGMAFLGEPRGPARIACFVLILAGMVGLRLVDRPPAPG